MNAVATLGDHPSLLDMEICVFQGAETLDGGKFPEIMKGVSGRAFDGATLIKSKSIQSVAFVDGRGFTAFVDSNPQSERQSVLMVSAESFPGLVVYGPIPDCLKW
jgi:hypothetical protein